jgi:hypothetical protein
MLEEIGISGSAAAAGVVLTGEQQRWRQDRSC